MNTRTLFLLLAVGTGCNTELPGWIQMNAEVVDGDETSANAPVVVYGTAGEVVEESADTGIRAPTTSGSTGLFLQHNSSADICYVHIHACGADSATQQVCGQGESAGTPVTDAIDVLRDKVLKADDNAQLWLEDDCVSVFAVDCERLRCWSTGDIELSTGIQTVLFKG